MKVSKIIFIKNFQLYSIKKLSLPIFYNKKICQTFLLPKIFTVWYCVCPYVHVIVRLYVRDVFMHVCVYAHVCAYICVYVYMYVCAIVVSWQEYDILVITRVWGKAKDEC